ncbi:Lipid carrier : UDP-N-acetylgalactosaminyltransferase / Alpha-1,3-N-acetylgalactosamine transferase PglA; Putative glycosyltransferase [hydrothermal vent metagenome]|uniref:Lipid carrier: UDP-N-acetylgalactosaminyltransferase / Alpha-1,3-N-acetylgalactosamine transferase PglA Putative glycosyltransferase n=1 Tax=hydrothermal vent metagenome TaxID=652676 RepID=A0A3B1CAA6_9ZZZZ
MRNIMGERYKIIYFVTEDWYFWLHRMPIAKAALKEGYDVIVATAVAEHGEKIKSEGLRLAPLGLNRSGKNPLREFASLLEITRLYRKEKPDIAHHVALKPVIYGAVAAVLSKTPLTVNALAGLGHVFIAKGFKAALVRFFIKAALRFSLRRKSAITIFENPDDLNLLVKMGLLDERQAVLIKGTGVDTSLFAPPEQELPSDEAPVVLLSSRMLMTKGIGDFVEAARILKKRQTNVRMVLAGSPDPHNPMSIPLSRLEEWDKEGAVEYWGFKEDMAELLKQVSIVVLPSFYGEGVPRSLMEAASAERPVVTYDVPGCREIIRHNVNGLLVPLRDIEALADAIAVLLEDGELRKKMGAEGRRIVEEEFSEEIVVEKTMNLYERAMEK